MMITHESTVLNIVVVSALIGRGIQKENTFQLFKVVTVPYGRLRASLARFSLARASLARFTLARFQFDAIPVRCVSHVCVYVDPVQQAIFCEGQFGARSVSICAHVSFLRLFSAKKCFLRQFAAKPLY